MDNTHSPLKQLREELTELQDQLQHMLAINQYQRQAIYAWFETHEDSHTDNVLLGLSLTDIWQCSNEQRLKQKVCEIQDSIQ